MIELAEQIAALSGIPDARVFFTTSGTEANDTALLLATAYRQVEPGAGDAQQLPRPLLHGPGHHRAQRSWSSTSLSGLNVTFVQGGYRLRSPFRARSTTSDFTEACVDDLAQLLDMTTAGDVACLIAEPIQGVGGFATPPDGFFGAMKKELDNRGILFISDEVQTGWGRTGEHFWGYQAHGVVPDMLTFAKGVGNGITLAGVVARAEIMDTIKVPIVLDLRRQPAVGRRPASPRSLRARARPSAQRQGHGRSPPCRPRLPSSTRPRGSPRSGAGA